MSLYGGDGHVRDGDGFRVEEVVLIFIGFDSGELEAAVAAATVSLYDGAVLATIIDLMFVGSDDLVHATSA